MKQLSEYLFLGALGGSLYHTIEILFRGFSHWTMFALGGICMTFITWQGKLVSFRDALWKQVARCTLFVTAGEFITGIVANKWFHLGVWDYSDQKFHLFGQICVNFTLLFSMLCTAGIFLAKTVLCFVYREDFPLLFKTKK